MSQGYYEGDDDEGYAPPPPQGQQQKTPAEYAAERREKRELREAREAKEKAERELAFYRAGIDPNSSGIAGYFVKGYDGDLSPEAIRQAAIDAGLAQAPQATPEQQQAQDAQQQAIAAQQRIADAAGSQTASPTAQDAQIRAMEDSLNAGGIEALTATMGAMGIPQTSY